VNKVPENPKTKKKKIIFFIAEKVLMDENIFYNIMINLSKTKQSLGFNVIHSDAVGILTVPKIDN